MPSMFDNFIRALEIIAPIFAGIVSIWLTSRMKMKEKKQSEEYEEKKRRESQQDEQNRQILSAIQDLRTSITGQVDQLKRDVESTTTAVAKLEEYDRNVEKDIKTLSKQNRTSAGYVRELINLTITLAEGMRDQHLDGNITAAAARFRKFEDEDVFNRLTD